MAGPRLSGTASNRQLIRRLLGLTWRYRAGCLRVLICQLILLGTGLSGIGFTGLGIDVIRHAADPSGRPPHWPGGWEPPPAWPTLAVIGGIAGAVFLFAVFRAVLNYLNGVALAALVQGQIVVDLRAEIYDRLQRLSFRFFDANASSSLINRVTGDVQALRMFVDQVLIQTVVMVVSLAAYITYMTQIHLGLTLACLASTPLLWAVSSTFARVVQPAYAKNRELVDAMVQRLVESLRGIRVIKAFGREAGEIARFERANDTVRDQQRWVFRRVSTFTPVIGFLSQANLVVLLAYGGALAVAGEIQVGTGLVAFAAILQQFSGQISNLANVSNSMQQALRSAARVFEVLDAPLDIKSPPNPVRLPAAPGAIRFEGVWFDHGSDPVLQDLNFTVEPGQCVAVVGPTGAGKSALLSLIPRFYDPTSGRITIGGIDLRDLEVDELRRAIGLVFQESFLFSTTVAANIAFGRPRASRAEIEEAARIAAADGFIAQLPKGYDTVLGEGGVGLSGGQRQRLAIARAVLRQPSILILDDPTASVDPGTEEEIIAALDGVRHGRTTFIVAHRPALLRRADLAVVLDHGRIGQIGPPAELIDEPGYFAASIGQQETGVWKP